VVWRQERTALSLIKRHCPDEVMPDSSDHRTLRKNSIVYRPDESSEHVYLLKSGSVRLYRLTEDGQDAEGVRRRHRAEADRRHRAFRGHCAPSRHDGQRGVPHCRDGHVQHIRCGIEVRHPQGDRRLQRDDVWRSVRADSYATSKSSTKSRRRRFMCARERTFTAFALATCLSASREDLFALSLCPPLCKCLARRINKPIRRIFYGAPSHREAFP